MYIMRGSGKASCKLCRKIIKKEEIDVVMTGFRMVKHYHKLCIDTEIKEFEEKEHQVNAEF